MLFTEFWVREQRFKTPFFFLLLLLLNNITYNALAAAPYLKTTDLGALHVRVHGRPRVPPCFTFESTRGERKTTMKVMLCARSKKKKIAS